MRLVAILICLFSSSVLAYEERTHELLSTEALKVSILADTNKQVLVKLGLKSELFDRSNQAFPNSNNRDQSINQLIRFGAEFEDDHVTERSLHHFYDPFYDRALDIPGLSLFREPKTSPDWVIEDIADIPAQDYSYKDAVNYFFLALTSQTELERNANWGLTFQSLGHVIHHIQDMSQPQHVRNDDHCNLGVLDCFFRHDPSFYEEYTGTNISQTIPSYITLDYPIPSFPTVREYWTTPDDKGIADFTNLNFFSKDSNFQYLNGTISPSAEYTSPVPNLTPISRNIADADLLGVAGQTLCDELKTVYNLDNPPVGDCFIDFIQTTVTDELNPGLSSVNPKAASLSIFDDKLQTSNINVELGDEDGDLVTVDRIPSLNEFNFKAAHQYLIPRAVSYGGGIINHFFSERFSVTADPVTEVFKLLNISGDTMYGSFYLYGEIFDDTDNLQLIETWAIPTSGIADGAELNVTIPELSQYKNDFKIIYRGKIGSAQLESIDMETLTSQNALANVQVRSDVYKYTGGVLQPRKFEAERETTYHYNFRNYTFMTRAESSTSPSDHPSNPSIFQVTNYFWSLINSLTLCIAEEVGTYGEGGSAFSLINSNHYAPAEHYLEPDPTDVTAADCDAIPYGYRTGTWNRGWLSKFGKPPVKMSSWIGVNCSFCDTTTNPFIGTVGAIINMTKYDTGLGGCVDINLGNIHPDIIPSYETYAEYLSKDPYGDIVNFIPPQLLDYRCY